MTSSAHADGYEQPANEWQWETWSTQLYPCEEPPSCPLPARPPPAHRPGTPPHTTPRSPPREPSAQRDLLTTLHATPSATIVPAWSESGRAVRLVRSAGAVGGPAPASVHTSTGTRHVARGELTGRLTAPQPSEAPRTWPHPAQGPSSEAPEGKWHSRVCEDTAALAPAPEPLEIVRVATLGPCGGIALDQPCQIFRARPIQPEHPSDRGPHTAQSPSGRTCRNVLVSH